MKRHNTDNRILSAKKAIVSIRPPGNPEAFYNDGNYGSNMQNFSNSNNAFSANNNNNNNKQYYKNQMRWHNTAMTAAPTGSQHSPNTRMQNELAIMPQSVTGGQQNQLNGPSPRHQTGPRVPFNLSSLGLHCPPPRLSMQENILRAINQPPPSATLASQNGNLSLVQQNNNSPRPPQNLTKQTTRPLRPEISQLVIFDPTHPPPNLQSPPPPPPLPLLAPPLPKKKINVPKPNSKLNWVNKNIGVTPKQNTLKLTKNNNKAQKKVDPKQPPQPSTSQQDPNLLPYNESLDSGETTEGDSSATGMTINKKSKRKPMSTRYTRKKEWDRDDAIKAILLENDYNKLQRLPMLILKFPDPDLNKEIVKGYSSMIDNVHFQQPSTPRYCFAQLRYDADIDKVKEEISQITFGTGKIIVEKKNSGGEDKFEVRPEEIDPYTLYIGNLPTNVSVSTVKDKFPSAQRIDIGYAQRMKYTRYAFIRYQSVEDSMEAFRNTFNLVMESRSLIVRFRRQKGNVGLPGETKKQSKNELPATTPGETNVAATETKENDSSVDPNKSSDVSKANVPIIPNDDPTIITDLIDSKENVLTIAQQLMLNNGNFIREAIKSEITNNIRVKDEPLENDDDDFHLDIEEDDEEDDDDDDDGELPDEEDEDDEDQDDSEEEKEVDDEDADKYQMYHWDKIRQEELSAIEEKPDMQALMLYNPILDVPKPDMQVLMLYNPILDVTKVKDSSNNDEDPDEMYDSLNPDDDIEF